MICTTLIPSSDKKFQFGSFIFLIIYSSFLRNSICLIIASIFSFVCLSQVIYYTLKYLSFDYNIWVIWEFFWVIWEFFLSSFPCVMSDIFSIFKSLVIFMLDILSALLCFMLDILSALFPKTVSIFCNHLTWHLSSNLSPFNSKNSLTCFPRLSLAFWSLFTHIVQGSSIIYTRFKCKIWV